MIWYLNISLIVMFSYATCILYGYWLVCRVGIFPVLAITQPFKNSILLESFFKLYYLVFSCISYQKIYLVNICASFSLSTSSNFTFSPRFQYALPLPYIIFLSYSYHQCFTEIDLFQMCLWEFYYVALGYGGSRRAKETSKSK